MTDEVPGGDLAQGLNTYTALMQQRDHAMQSVLAAINADFGCELRLTCEACPVQVEGQIDGLAMNFRSRWDSWSLVMAADLDTAIRANRQAEAVFYHESCAGLSGFDASWLEPAQVDQALRACLTAFRAGHANAGYVELDE